MTIIISDNWSTGMNTKEVDPEVTNTILFYIYMSIGITETWYIYSTKIQYILESMVLHIIRSNTKKSHSLPSSQLDLCNINIPTIIHVVYINLFI